jgi:hypothetical protein
MSTVGSRWFLQSLHLDGSVSPLLVFLDFYFIFCLVSYFIAHLMMFS